MNIALRTREKMVLIAASEKPNILKLTSLQLMVFCFSCSKSSSFDSISDRFPVYQAPKSLNVGEKSLQILKFSLELNG